MSDEPIADQISSAQLEKLRLENEKLRREGAARWIARAGAFTPVLSVIIGVGGFLFGIYTFQAQQRVRDNTARLEQELTIQNRLRADVDGLLQFFSDKTQTLSTASYRFYDLKALLAICAAANPPVPTHERDITVSLVRAISDDCDFTDYRHAQFAAMLVEEWPSYGTYLRANPDMLQQITSKYADAAGMLSLKAPDVVAKVKYRPRENDIWFTEGYGSLSSRDASHFAKVLLGFRNHALLIADESVRSVEVGRLGNSINNLPLARDLLGIDPNAVGRISRSR
ncbi:MAG TPA: hypothetical protein VJZ76_15780 [Thermoanaerobaculia bacterium]|nr:hypothetical protein [Thermoanaerobaculia bacterium]